MTTMAEMKFVENKLQSFDINAKPSVTHTQIEKLQKVNLKKKQNRILLINECLFERMWIIRDVNMKFLNNISRIGCPVMNQ
jgi:hypothetical protein